ncbi:MAG TPA: hypothetical protein EYH30_03085 [Anaerolineales bacterium]|nr:hypothetical protein [Anaerolineales bacterium]
MSEDWKAIGEALDAFARVTSLFRHGGLGEEWELARRAKEAFRRVREGARATEGRERGQSFVVMLLVILPVLLLALGVAHDLGNAAAGVTIAQNAADLAAQEAGKLVDVGYMAEWGEVRLRPEAAMVAQQVADDLTGGAFQVEGVYVVGRNLVVVEGRVSVRTPFLRAFLGVPRLTRPVMGVAEAAHGAEGRGE